MLAANLRRGYDTTEIENLDMESNGRMAVNPELAELFYQASVDAFIAFRQQFPDETVFAFVLSTIDDAIYVNCSINSRESHQRRLAERGYDESHEDALETKWCSCEWENEYYGSEFFEAGNRLLNDLYEKSSEADEFPAFNKSVVDSMIEALVRLRKSGAISNPGDPIEIAMFATIYDSFSAEEVHRRSAKLLNSPELCKTFLPVIGS